MIQCVQKSLRLLFKPPEIYGHTNVVQVKALHHNLYLPVVTMNVPAIARVISKAVGKI